MHLTAQERDRLVVAQAAELARRRLARGARLGATEAAALIIDEVHEWAWDGMELDEVVARAKALLSPEQVLPRVPEMVAHLQVDALFPAGSFLVDLVNPIGLARDLVSSDGPPRELNHGRPRRQVTLTNESSRTVRVTSHVDISQINPLLRVEGEPVTGWRLDIPAGSSLAWAPGETRTVTFVPWESAASPRPAPAPVAEGISHDVA
jgi:urease subunit gamma/beta